MSLDTPCGIGCTCSGTHCEILDRFFQYLREAAVKVEFILIYMVESIMTIIIFMVKFIMTTEIRYSSSF